MFSITPCILIACSTLQHTPKEWQDKFLQQIDRDAITEMCTFSPQPFSEKAKWALLGDNKAPSLEDHLGKVIVVQSWTNHSGYGRDAIKTATKAVSSSSNPDDVVLLTIHTPQSIAGAREYMRKKKIGGPVLIDETGETCNALGFYKHPTNILIDRNGAVQYVGLGAKGLISAIDDLLGKPFDPEKEVKPFEPSTKAEVSPAKYPKHSKNIGKSNDVQGKSAPTFYVQEWIANEQDIVDKVRVVEFWATRSPLCCQKSIPHLNELAKEFGEDVCFIGVTAESKPVVESFIKKTPMEYGVAIDLSKQMQTAIGCSETPLAMVISSDGIVRWQGNPAFLTTGVIQQVLSADRGEGVPLKRGRWDTALNHGGSSGMSAGIGGSGGASFFGIASSGNRFCYIIDISGSMMLHLSLVLQELSNSLKSLPDFAQFYILFYHSSVVEPPSQRGWNRARPSVVRRMVSDFQAVIPTGGTNPNLAFEMAFALDPLPEVVYFLTDGDSLGFQLDELIQKMPKKKCSRCLQYKQIVINTISFRNNYTQKLLQDIAATTGGKYTSTDGNTRRSN
jgi:peroxiredoxin